AEGDSYGAHRGGFFLLVEDLTQQPALNPLHHHVDLATVAVRVYVHNAGMIDGLANIFFTVKAIEENRVSFHFGMGNFDGDGFARARIRGAKDGSHSAAGDDAVNPVVIELFAGVDGNPRERAGQEAARGPTLRKPVGSPAVHAHAFDASNADQLQADIITTVSLVGNIH